ncbi:ABC transporter substrate-binding protein (plasmid) [Pseudonocardia sp. EC080610-09]|uniref:aliphatic sulfonate ABC transporter substrate-binding protein n=1 Tax=unclassified Pseudonocardia TaxID=2619320 RepID=UPI000706A895|nr:MULTISPECIES: aliphatic sulfonate ABC transporter substrate-binding protein [unclassified Pseudonocardia]ALL79442.1 ABC transporter substrate-binding protein [Pseudonocardia sp. EC080610-09]ALL85605.1 ABC transporter substrate-binding protein [Pseudonocardia sp. EC080619-01]
MRLARTLVLLVALAVLGGCAAGENADGTVSPGGGGGTKVRLDYAYYNPESLVIRKQGWLEQELGPGSVEWVLSQGSNKANENLRAGVVDIGSTAGTPALLARANGSPIRSIDVYSRPEWSAIVVGRGSPITGPADLRGRKVAVTQGTDPYFFLVQALQQAGLDRDDVEIVNLQHSDGRTALERGDVDAWAGLDPFMAQSELDAGSTLIYRNLDFNSYGLLNADEAFLERDPDTAAAVVRAYERARAWILENPDDAVATLAEAASISPDVARTQLLERTRVDIDPVPGDAQRAVLERLVPVLVSEGLVRSEQDTRTALDTLFEPRFAQEAAGTRADGTAGP